MRDEPHVSVLMPARNNESFVAAAVASVLDQDYERLELIAVDDASDDATAEVLQQCAAEAPRGRMRVVRQPDQRGLPATRGHALRVAEGELIAVCDSDDLWLPDKLGPQVDLLSEHPNAGLVHSEFEVFVSETGETIPWGSRDWDRSEDSLVELVRIGCFVMTGSVLIRQAAIETRGLGFVDPGYAGYDDYLLYLTLALDWALVHDERVVMRYRRHAGNLTSVLFAGNLPLARARLLRQFVERFPEAEERIGAQLGQTLAEQLVLAAAHERHESPTRALALTAAAAHHDLPTAFRTTNRVVRDKLRRMLAA